MTMVQFRRWVRAQQSKGSLAAACRRKPAQK
jgi:hypothetical protein